MKRLLQLAILWLLGVSLAGAASAPPPNWGIWPQWGAQRDGTYQNPVVPGDYSDLDCIRVGSDYYAISSTFQFSPGVVILHSKDLVSWTILGHVVSDLNQIGPDLDWSRMNRYGKGVWAGAIRFHDGKFWVFFGTPDDGYFMSAAANPSGPWEPLHSVLKGAGWDDCCPFWDDDGQGYLVGSNFRDGYKIHLWQLTADGRDLVASTDHVIHQSKGSEANKLYKFNGLYYHLFSEVKAEGRAVMMERSANIFGPYTESRQLNHAEKAAMEPNQGGIVQTEAGGWYFLTHHGSGAWEGRCASLLPVTWVDGWPLIGQVGADGIGRMVWSGVLPVAGQPVVSPQSSDEFNETALPPQWEWNYQPRAGMWSLAERPGFLRLHAFKPLRPDDLMTAGDTLTQRVMRTTTNSVTLALDLGGMMAGQVAGLCHFAKDNSTLAVRQTGSVRTVECTHGKTVTSGPVVTGGKIWLRSTWGADGRSQYAYCLDGTAWVQYGEPYQLAWGSYRGDRIGIFTNNDQGEAGYVDADWFHYEYSGPGGGK